MPFRLVFIAATKLVGLVDPAAQLLGHPAKDEASEHLPLAVGQRRPAAVHPFRQRPGRPGQGALIAPPRPPRRLARHRLTKQSRSDSAGVAARLAVVLCDSDHDAFSLSTHGGPGQLGRGQAPGPGEVVELVVALVPHAGLVHLPQHVAAAMDTRQPDMLAHRRGGRPARALDPGGQLHAGGPSAHHQDPIRTGARETLARRSMNSATSPTVMYPSGSGPS
jgi:hypothetical protein